MHRFLQMVGVSLRFPSSATQRLASYASRPSFRDRLTKILFFVASVRDLFVRQLYRPSVFFPAIENCGGVCEEEASKEKHHKKR
jgi:hypothetical protein